MQSSQARRHAKKWFPMDAYDIADKLLAQTVFQASRRDYLRSGKEFCECGKAARCLRGTILRIFYRIQIRWLNKPWRAYEVRTDGSLKCANRTLKNFIPLSVFIRPLIKDVTFHHNICPVYKFSNEKRHHSLMFSG